MITSQIHIQTTDAKLQMNSSRPPMTIDQGPASMQNNKTGSDTLKISQQAAKLFIDQSKAFAEANLKTGSQLAADWAAKGQAAAREYAAAKAQEGTQLTKIERGVTFAKLAQQENHVAPPTSTIAYMPHSIDRVKIQVQPGQFDLEAPNSDLSIDVIPTPVNLHIPKWSTSSHLSQKPSILFSVEQA